MEFKKAGRAEAEPGEWVRHYQEAPLGPNEQEPRKIYTGIEFKIRRIPPGKKLEVDRLHRGTERKIKIFRSGDSEVTRDIAKEVAIGIDLAIFALVDSKDCSVRIVDDDAAKTYGKFLNDSSIKIDDLVCLDGRWTKEIREDFLTDYVDVASWIVARADEIGQLKAEEDRGKEKASSTTPFSA